MTAAGPNTSPASNRFIQRDCNIEFSAAQRR
jgi:hypothetical protein